MHYSRRRLLRRGLEFHVCTINKSAHRKKAGNLFNDPRMFPAARRWMGPAWKLPSAGKYRGRASPWHP